MTVESSSDPNRSAKRNALILSAAQAFGGSAAPIAISMGGLAGLYLLDSDKSLATAPVTGYNIGVALGALPAALLMARVGRRLGFMGGCVIGILGALLSCYAILKAISGCFAWGWLFRVLEGRLPSNIGLRQPMKEPQHSSPRRYHGCWQADCLRRLSGHKQPSPLETGLPR